MSENEEIMNETENETMAAEVEAVETVETEAAEVEAADEVSAEEEAEVVEMCIRDRPRPCAAMRKAPQATAINPAILPPVSFSPKMSGESAMTMMGPQ